MVGSYLTPTLSLEERQLQARKKASYGRQLVTE
jgi:hypothetical protein